MENINKDELKESIKTIINEGLKSDFKKSPDGRNVFAIKPYINSLITEAQKNPKLMSYLTRFDEAINRGAKQFLLFEEFGTGLSQFATGNKIIKGVINKMNEINAEHNSDLNTYKLIENVSDEDLQEDLLESYNDYIDDPCDETKSMLLEHIDNVYNFNEQLAMNLTLMVSEAQNKNPEMFATSAINESEQIEMENKIKKSRENKISENIFKKVERYLDERFNQEEIMKKHVSEKNSLAGIVNKNGLNLSEKLSKVLKSDAAKNENLKNILLQYTDALAQGAYEERLYETLLQNTSKYNYLLPVDKMRKAILETADKNKENITLTKILEEMKDSYQSYIYVELIQEDVARYVNNPNAVNRVQLQNALMPYAADPYINEMFKIIYSDDSYSANALSEKAISIKEQIDIIKNNATVSNIYSPVQYIRENESIFNVYGTYYVKKGNNLSVLDKKYIGQLDERFVDMCKLVNDPHVRIFEDHIELSGTEQVAEIYKGYVEIGGYKEDAVSLRRLDEMCMKYENYDTNFYIMCSCLLENFDNIAKIDWAKHITLNENSDITANLFKLDENIYMSTHNNALMKHTFYRNVNPIFCKNTLNEHMGINVSSLFSDLLPNQDKIILQLNETKNDYEESIKKYEKALEDLKDTEEQTNSEDIKNQISDKITDIEKKLSDLKDEYKQWQEDTEETERDTEKEKDSEENADEVVDKDEESGDNVTRETSNEPLDKDEVDDYAQQFGTPLGDNDGAATAPEAVPADSSTEATPEAETDVPSDQISDDEFSEFMSDDATDDTTNPDDEIDTDDVDAAATDADDEIEDTDDTADSDDIPAEGTDDTDSEEFKTVDTDSITDNTYDSSDDEDIFEPEDVSTDTPKEDVHDDEDIVMDEPEEDTTDDEEVPDVETVDVDNEEPADDTEPADDAAQATDLFGGSTKDPLETDTKVDNDLYDPHTETSEFNIVNVMFDGNVNDEKPMKSGSIMVIKPMVDKTGKKFVDSETIHFYLTGEDNKPIIQSPTDMSTSMYDAIINSIKNHPDYNFVCTNGTEVSSVPAEIDATEKPVESGDDWETEFSQEGNDEDKGNYIIGDDDSTDDAEIPEVIDTDDVDNTDTIPSDDVAVDYEVPVDDIEVTTEKPEDAKITDASTGDDDYDFSNIFGDLAGDETDATDPVNTYDDGDTEIEVPAPSAASEEDPVASEDSSTDIVPAAPAEPVKQDPLSVTDDIVDDTDTTDIDSDDELDSLLLGSDDEDDESSDSTADESTVVKNESHVKKITKEQMNENKKHILFIKKNK